MKPLILNQWHCLMMLRRIVSFNTLAYNVYLSLTAGISEAEAWKELAEDEEDWLVNGGVALHKMSPAAFLVIGLDLEESQ
jgi:hypothetical protein